MKTIEKEINRLPDPKKSLPNLVIRNWIKERIIELSSLEQTDDIISTIKKLNNSNPDEMIIEPPVISTEDNVKVCVVSRKVGVLWYDVNVRKLAFNEFLEYCFENKECNSSIYKEEPYTLEELETLFRSDKSVPVPGYIDVKDSDGIVKKVIIADVLDETTVHREKLLGEFLFEEVKTNIYGYPEDNQPIYPFSTLKDISLAITTIKDSFFKEVVELYSVPINIIRSLINENDKPPVITDITVGGSSTVEEVPIKTDSDVSYTVTNNVLITLDKPPKNTDIKLLSLDDKFGNGIDEKDYSYRILSTDDKNKVNLEIKLHNYTRKFFAPDEVGKKLGFIAKICVDKTEIVKDITLDVTWSNKGNTHFVNILSNKDDFSEENSYPLKLALNIRGSDEYEHDLTPLVLSNTDELLKTSSTVPVLKDVKYTLGNDNNKPFISFNFVKDKYGIFDLQFKDTRIIDSKYLLVENNLEVSTVITNSSYNKEKETLTFYHNFKTKYDENIEDVSIVNGYKDLKVSLNNGEGLVPSTGNIAGGGFSYITMTVPFKGDDSNLNIKVTGTAIVGINKIEYPFTTEYVHNLIKKDIKNITVNKDPITIDYPSNKFNLLDNIKISTTENVELEDLEFLSLINNSKELKDKAIVKFTKIKDGEFNLSLSVDGYDLPLTFTDGNAEGYFSTRIGLVGSPVEETYTNNISYKTNKLKNTITPFVSTLKYNSLEDMTLNIAFNGSNGIIKNGLNQLLNNELFKQTSSILYTLNDKNIKYAEDSKSNYTAGIKTKANAFGRTVLEFDDPAFKTIKVDTVDPNSAYTLNKTSDSIENNVLTIEFELYKDGAKWNSVDTFSAPFELKLTIDGKKYDQSGSGFNNNPEGAVVRLMYDIGDLTDINYTLKGNVYIGMNAVPITINLENQNVKKA